MLRMSMLARQLAALPAMVALAALACATTDSAQAPSPQNTGAALQPGGVLRSDQNGRPLECAADFFLCGPFPGGDNLATCCLRGTRCSSVADTPACVPLDPGE